MMRLTLTGLDRRDGSLVGSADDHRTRVENGSSGSGRTGGTHDDGSYDDVDDAVRGERDDNGGGDGGGGGDDDDGGGSTTSDVSVSVN